MLEEIIAAREVVQLMRVGRASDDGTARAVIDDGSLRRLMVLSFGAIMPSAEMIVRVNGALPSSTHRSGPHRLRGRWQRRDTRTRITESEPSLRISALTHDGPLSIISLDHLHSIHVRAKRFRYENAAVLLLVVL